MNAKALDGKVALITGAGQGIGLAIARAFASAGARLAITGRDAGKIEKAAQGLAALGAEVLTLDVLVNNAQASVPGVPLAEIDDDMIALSMGSGLHGTLFHMQAAYPHMKGRGGSIINFGSRTGTAGEVGFGIYAATKEGIRGLSRVAAREWGPEGIRVNVICPAALSDAAKQYAIDFPEQNAYFMSIIPLRRLGDPEADIAPVVVFLASDDARYVTGQTINAEGGMTMF
jgi:NAD(P)-dependent dehydrogenase (short-subunit alcohol dehydrogenase family)